MMRGFIGRGAYNVLYSLRLSRLDGLSRLCRQCGQNRQLECFFLSYASSLGGACEYKFDVSRECEDLDMQAECCLWASTRWL